jgi:diguanylate cyclase (GGDEF)-like protein
MDAHADAGTPPEGAALHTPLQALLEALPCPAWAAEAAGGRVVAANAAAAALLGCTTRALLGRTSLDLVASPEDIAYWDEVRAGGPLPSLLSDALLALNAPDHVGKSPRTMHAERSIRPIAGTGTDTGSGAGSGLLLVTVTDRSDARRLEDEREARLSDLQATLESTADGLLVTDPDGRVRAFNRRFAEMWALPADLLQQGDGAAVQVWLRRSIVDSDGYPRLLAGLRDQPLRETIERLALIDGRVFEAATRPLMRDGRPRGRVWAFRDLSERLAAAERIEHLEHSDALTGLPSRHHFGERLGAALAQLPPGREGVALLLIDLDRFRQINDTLGHDAGDELLRDVARRLGSCCRDGDMLARTAGDQFALLLQPADMHAAEITARRVLHVISQPGAGDAAQFTLTCSIGIALAPAHTRDAGELMRYAEAAMEQAKEGGRAGVRVHQARTEVDRREHMRLEHAMRQALAAGRFRLAYQPQVDLDSGALVGAEALLRWRDPEFGDVPPARFIPVAEDSGLIVPIGDWLLSQAAGQAALWHRRGHEVPVSINVSALQFHQPHFVDRVAHVLAAHGLPPRLLELELTESILLRGADEALPRLHALARLGIGLSIDDFGTGYSSLAYLKRFPLCKLKIDRAFVRGLPGDESDAGIVCAILQMARALKVRVVAEGVEQEAQREFLRAAGCDAFQGWLYAPALDPLTFEQRLAQGAAEPPARPRMRLVSG